MARYETKYDVGDMVYVIWCNQPTKMEITEIRCTISKKSKEVLYSLGDIRDRSFRQDMLFKTKEELIKWIEENCK